MRRSAVSIGKLPAVTQMNTVSSDESIPPPGLLGSASSSTYTSYDMTGTIYQTSGFDGAQAYDCNAQCSSSGSSDTSCEGVCTDPTCQVWNTASVHDTETCSLQSCLSPDVCESSVCCREEACVRPSDLTIAPTQSNYEQERPPQPEYSDLFGYNLDEPNGSMPCQWLDTDYQCPVSGPPAALSLHVNKHHIDPNAWLTCGWNQCDQYVESQHIAEHVSQKHHPDQYVCLWQGCGSSFSTGEELAAHMSALHTTKLDCHWGGCDSTLMDPDALKMHVNDEHLNFNFDGAYHQDIDEGMPLVASPTSPTSIEEPVVHDDVLPETGSGTKHCMWIDDLSTNSTCGACFGHENDLQDHVDKTHIATAPQGVSDLLVCKWQGCRAAGNMQNNKHRLRKHMWTHTRCESSFWAFGIAKSNFHQGYWFECNDCGRRFNAKAPYENHLRIHTKEKPFKCDKCSSTFSSKDALSMQICP